MRFDKFTLKSQELIQEANSAASAYKNQQIEPAHFLFVMLKEQDSIAGSILRKIGIAPDDVIRKAQQSIENLPKIQDAVGDPYLSGDCRKMLEKAFSEASNMKDQYVSIEHIFLAIFDIKDNRLEKIFKQFSSTLRTRCPWKF
jgi:ATP-dependent Clp protease ATP-binding subunit ClpB